MLRPGDSYDQRLLDAGLMIAPDSLCMTVGVIVMSDVSRDSAPGAVPPYLVSHA